MPSGKPEGIFLCFLTSKPEGEDVSQRCQVYLNSAKNVDDKMNVILKTKLGYVGLGVVLFVWFLFNIKLKKCKPQWTQDLPSLVTHNKSTTS